MKDQAFIDSDVLISHLRGERKALNPLKKLRDKVKCEMWTGPMQSAEVVFFMRPAEEDATLLFYRSFRLHQLISGSSTRLVNFIAGGPPTMELVSTMLSRQQPPCRPEGK